MIRVSFELTSTLDVAQLDFALDNSISLKYCKKTIEKSYANNKMKRNFTIKLNIRNGDMQDDEGDGSINACAVFPSSSINEVRKRYLTYQ